MRTITLTTDFGLRDWFVGTMKGVVLRLHPRAQIVDLTHEIPPGDLRAGAFALRAGCRFFPQGTVHVAIVDPGVGSSRRALAVETADYLFVGPDNGVLSWALARERIQTIRLLERPEYFLAPVSRTFHGRDVFAPVAAHLSRGLPVARLGREVTDFVRLPWPQPACSGGEWRGEVVCVDRFGNAITNLETERLTNHGRGWCVVVGRRRMRCPVVSCYADVPPGGLLAVPGSSGLLEIAVNGGSAAQRLGLRVGDPVRAATVGMRPRGVSFRLPRRGAPAAPPVRSSTTSKAQRWAGKRRVS